MKDGYKTTEFWLTLVTTVLMVLVALGVIGEDQAQEIEGLVEPLVAAVIPIVLYIISRTVVKAFNGPR